MHAHIDQYTCEEQTARHDGYVTNHRKNTVEILENIKVMVLFNDERLKLKLNLLPKLQ